MFSQQIHELIKVMMSMSVIIPLPSSQRRLIHILKSCALCSHLCIWSISSRISLFSSFHPLKSSCTICDTMQCTHTQKLAVFQHFFFLEIPTQNNPSSEQWVTVHFTGYNYAKLSERYPLPIDTLLANHSSNS